MMYRNSASLPIGLPEVNAGILLGMAKSTRPITRTAFGERLFKAREDAGLTQTEAAQKVGMGQTTLAEAERTATGSSFTAALADLYRVRAKWLATGEGPRDAAVESAPPWPLERITPAEWKLLSPTERALMEDAAILKLRELRAEVASRPFVAPEKAHRRAAA